MTQERRSAESTAACSRPNCCGLSPCSSSERMAQAMAVESASNFSLGIDAILYCGGAFGADEFGPDAVPIPAQHPAAQNAIGDALQAAGLTGLHVATAGEALIQVGVIDAVGFRQGPTLGWGDLHAPKHSDSLPFVQAIRYMKDGGTLLELGPMETIEERRKRRLADLCERMRGRGGLRYIADQANVNQQYLSQVLKGTLLPPKKSDGSRSPRSLGTELARRIEDALSLGVGWFDADEPAISKETPEHRANSALVNYSARFTLLPVVGFQGAVMSQRNDEIKEASVDWVSAPGAFSPYAKYMQMPDDSMAPEIYPGEYVCFDPEVEPDTGDIVMLADQHGGLWVRRYRPLPAGRFDAVPANDTHAPLRSGEDGLRVLAVMVGHWRGRRARRH